MPLLKHLHEIIPKNFLNPTSRSSAEEREFLNQVRKRESEVLRIILLVGFFGMLAVWPTDWLLYEGQTFHAFQTWRLLVSVIWVAALVGTYFSDTLGDYTGYLVIVTVAMADFIVCYIFGYTFESGFASPYFYWTYILPFLPCFVISLRFVERILANILLVVPAFTGFILADPSHLSYEHAASPFLLHASFFPVAVIAGHLVHNLYRQYYFVNQELEESLEQQEVLFQELNHRVKNNMQVIMSLLDMQSREFDDDTVTEKLLSVRRRIRSMALVHERLYQTGEVTQVSLGDYLEDLVTGISRGLGFEPDMVTFNTPGEPFTIPFETAVSVGLIVNELVTNATEHAYESVSEPKLVLEAAEKNGHCRILIKDNGGCLNDSWGDLDEGSFGYNIVNVLVNRNLEGTLDWTSDDWTVFELTFPVEEVEEIPVSG
jgi:two-component sensor histidine kinase